MTTLCFDVSGLSMDDRFQKLGCMLDAVETVLRNQVQQKDHLMIHLSAYNHFNAPEANTNGINLEDLQTIKVNEPDNSVAAVNNENHNNLPNACSGNANSLPTPTENKSSYNNLPEPSAINVGNQNNLPVAKIINQDIPMPDNFSIEVPLVNGLREIGGLKTVKNELFTLVVLPKLQPQLYSRINRCCSVLLYGPPGTGKTRLAHGLAAESGAVFLSLSVRDILSSFVGETEKNMGKLFDYLRTTKSYTLLFIDEIDSLCRGRTSSEADYSRRIKTELMCQLNKMEQLRNCVILAATNCPWDLDAAFLRRFQKHIFVPLPTAEDRIELFQILAKDLSIFQNQEQLSEFISVTEGFTGSDIANLVNDAQHMPLNELEYAKLWRFTPDGCFEPIINEAELLTNGIVIEVSELKNLPPGSVRCRPVTVRDFLEAAKKVHVTARMEDIQKYENYRNNK
ncbi:unnamed protein product [Ceutorhynchus assimilis]|uniref:AAA+ ATPase domain-containing protein n=1 Tax=Ceutorhynchus assimilis TaxID=467358 RepID=A0A9N9QMX2_9CUCU|nr:unnamed protein product [Ceutorhynchus assimilis]